MVRIGGSTDTGKHIKEHDYYTPTGEFRVDREGSPVLLNCLMYKMCYYRFGQVYTEASEYLFVQLLKIIASFDVFPVNIVTPTFNDPALRLSCWGKKVIYMVCICVINILLSFSVILLNIIIILVFNIILSILWFY